MRTYTVISEFDGLPLSVLEIAPEGEVRLVVQLVHGICEYKERYIPYMEYLASRGCLAVMHDHRGHGASVRSKEDLGHCGKHGADAAVDDMHQITLELRRRYPDVKLVLLGHSMGTLTARAYADKYDADIDALVLTGSPAEARGAAVGGLVLLALWQLARGDRYRSEFLWSLVTGTFGKDKSRLTDRGASLTDELTFTVGGDRALMYLMLRAYGIKPPRAHADMPVRLYSGTRDHYAPKKEQFTNAIEKLRRGGYKDVRGRTFEGLHHDILTIDGSPEVYDTIFREAMEGLMR